MILGREDIFVSDTSIVIHSVVSTSQGKKKLVYNMSIPGMNDRMGDALAEALAAGFRWKLISSEWEQYSHEYDLNSPDCPDFGIMNDVALGLCCYTIYRFTDDHSLEVENEKCCLCIRLEENTAVLDEYDQRIIQAVRRVVLS